MRLTNLPRPYAEIDLRRLALDSRTTFTRASTQTYVGHDGLLRTAANDECPLVYDQVSAALLGRAFWQASTNLLRQSQAFNAPAWATGVGGTGIAPGVTPAAGAAPDGSFTASRVVFDRGASNASADMSYLIQATPMTAGVPYTISVWMRTLSGTARVFVDTDSGNSNVVTVTPMWQRFSVTRTPATTTGRQNRIGVRGGTGSDAAATVLMWQAQLEVGASATPDIATDAATATRAADVASIPAAALRIGTSGTLVVRHAVPAGNPLLASNGVAALTSTGPGVIALAWTPGGARVCSNGGAVTSAPVPSLGSTLQIGSDGIAWANGPLAYLRGYPRTLADAELQRVSA